MHSDIDSSPLGRNLSVMKASEINPPRQASGSDSGRADCTPSCDFIDLSLLEDSLAKTVWERMLANDDAFRLADLLQAAMRSSRAKSQRIDTKTG